MTISNLTKFENIDLARGHPTFFEKSRLISGPLREKKCAGARCFLGPLSDILLWFSCFVVCYRLRLKKPAMCIKIFDEHLSIVAVQKCATESEFMTMLKSYIE